MTKKNAPAKLTVELYKRLNTWRTSVGIESDTLAQDLAEIHAASAVLTSRISELAAIEKGETDAALRILGDVEGWIAEFEDHAARLKKPLDKAMDLLAHV